MKRIDYHIHSQFSPDSSMTMEDACQRAINLGVTEICFTDHLEFAYDYIVDFEAYQQALQGVQLKYGNKLFIKCGLEVGFDKDAEERIVEYLRDKELDFIIGSMHRADGFGLFDGSFFEGKSIDKAFREYFIALKIAVDNYDFYSVVGHIGLIKRFLWLLRVKPGDIRWSAYHEQIRDILQVIIHKGKGIELNLRGSLIELDYAILRIYKELGGEIITIGTDAHRTTQMMNMDDGLQVLEEIGFRYITLFDKQVPVFVPIRS